MSELSLAEVVLFGLEEDSGIVPDGDLLERIEKAPPAARRRLGRLDAAVFGVCAITPLELAGVLTGLATDAVGDDGRIDTDKAWEAVVVARDAPVDAAPDATADRLLAIAHAALGLGAPCQACTDWQPEDHDDADGVTEPGDDEDGEDGTDGHDQAHDAPASLVDRVFDVHADALDAWPAQVALRIAANAGDSLTEIAGFDVLHEVVGHRRGVDGISGEQRGELHVVQHVGMSLCVDAAQMHGLAVAYPRLTGDGSVADAMDEAEAVAAEESGVMAAVIASVIVDRLAPMVEESLASAPPQGPPSKRPRNRRRSR
ncbi:MAG: hypothetical protein KDC33_05570 [Thermoleophilia bacterium]|nr:hypothetical protein [Thermoleophilia bacterium]